jgi:hypothetical protein
MSGAPLADWSTLPEDERVHTWRFCRLLDLGYGITQAEELAAGDVDLHELESLVLARGCPLDVAARILAPLERATPLVDLVGALQFRDAPIGATA